MRRTPLIVATLGLAVLLAACDPTHPVTTPGPAGATCIVGTVDCNDADLGQADNDEGAARSLLGVAKHDLADDVRIARIDDETFALTDDYVIGRTTVELERDGNHVPRVVKVTVELEDGPITVD